MSVSEVPEWSPARGREIAAVAKFLGPGSSREVRITTRDGQVYLGTSVQALYDVLVLSNGWRPGSEIALADIVRIERRRLRLGRALLIGTGVLALGVVIGGLVGARRGASIAPSPRDAAFLGGLVGAFVAPFVVWLLQDSPLLRQWRTLFE